MRTEHLGGRSTTTNGVHDLDSQRSVDASSSSVDMCLARSPSAWAAYGSRSDTNHFTATDASTTTNAGVSLIERPPPVAGIAVLAYQFGRVSAGRDKLGNLTCVSYRCLDASATLVVCLFLTDLTHVPRRGLSDEPAPRVMKLIGKGVDVPQEVVGKRNVDLGQDGASE